MIFPILLVGFAIKIKNKIKSIFKCQVVLFVLSYYKSRALSTIGFDSEIIERLIVSGSTKFDSVIVSR